MTVSNSPRLFHGLAAVVLFFLVTGPAWAVDQPTRKVTVTGTAIIKVVPDQMHWTVQISIDDSTLAKAKARHDDSLADALKFVKSLGSGVKDLQTGGISIQKNTYAPQGSPAAERPFNCSTQLTFTLTDFDKYAGLCDGLAKLDGVQVQSVEYAYSKQSDVRRDALKQALLNARDKANDLAVTANCYIDKPLEILEGSGEGPHPLMMNALARSASPGTAGPVAGQIEIEATVTATYDMFYR